MLFGMSGTFLVAVIGLFFYGLCINLEEIPGMTYFQNRLPETVYGRFFSTWMMAAASGGFIGSLLVPILIQRYSVTFALVAVAVPCITLGIFFAIRGGGLQMKRPFLPPVAAIQAEIEQSIPPVDDPAIASADPIVEADFADS